MCKYSGHKMFWWDHQEWLERQKSFTQEFWEEYRTKHKGTNDSVAMEVKQHFKAASKWDRMSLNAPTQGEQPLPWLNSLNSVNPAMGIPSQA